MTRLFWFTAPLVAAILIVPLRAEVIEQVLVKVNGEIISLSDFERRQFEALRTRPELGKLPLGSPQLAQAVAEVTPTVILEAVDELLLMQRAREFGWALTDATFSSVIANIRKSNNLEDEVAFRRELEAAGLTEAALRAQIEREMLISQVQRTEVFDKIDVTEEEVRTYYTANSRTFVTPAEVTLREILIAVPVSDGGINVARDDEARARAEETRARLVAGEPFPRLAGEVSASASRANGGLIGPLSVDELSPSLQEMLEKMQVGDLTELLRTAQGYQILKLESRTATRVRTLEDARQDVAQRIIEEKSLGEMMKYLERLRAQAKIIWRNDEVQRAYDKALAERQAGLGLAAKVS